MALIVFKNHSDYALKQWLDNWPLSAHPLDEQRFMVFAKTVAKYRNKKWLKYANFEKALKESTHPFDDDEIEKYYFKLQAFVEFYSTPAIQSIVTTNDKDYGYYQRGVLKGRMYQVPISKAEYFKGASKDTLAKAEFFSD